MCFFERGLTDPDNDGLNIEYEARCVLALDDMVERNKLGTVALVKQPKPLWFRNGAVYYNGVQFIIINFVYTYGGLRFY